MVTARIVFIGISMVNPADNNGFPEFGLFV